MRFPSGVLALLVSIPLLLQGISLVSLPNRWRRLGILSLTLAGLGVIAFILMASGVLVLSWELGVVLIEGTAGRAGVWTLLIGLSVAAGLALHVVRCAAGSTVRLEWLAIGGLAIGVGACFCFNTLNPFDPAPLRVYEFDLWWPPLACWLAVCVLGIVLAISGVKARRHWFVFSLGVVALFALGAVGRTRLQLLYAHFTTRPMWLAAFCIALPVVLTAGALSLRVPWRGRTLFDNRWRGALGAAVFLAALASCLAWAYGEFLTVVFAFWGAAALVAIVAVVVVAGPHLVLWRKSGYPIHDFGHPGRWDDILIVSSVLAIVAGIADLLAFHLVDPLLVVAVLVTAWVVIVEIMTGGHFADMIIPSPLVKATTEIASGAWGLLTGAATRVQGAVKSDSWPMATMKTVLAVVVGIILLVICAELPNAGKTTLGTFAVTLPGDPKGDEKPTPMEEKLARLIPNRVLSSLGRLRSELRTEVITLSPKSDTNKKEAAARFGTPAESPIGWDAVLAKGSELKLAGVEIPLGVLASPVQTLMRSLLAERAITGGFYSERDHFVLHAASSAGDYWRTIPQPDEPAPPSVLEAANDLSEQIAFQMISGDPAMTSSGMTDRWPALVEFRYGLAKWYEYTAGNPDALTEAIRHFQEAIHKDSDFALAYYRLGMAYRDDEQPALAVKHLRKSIEVRPDFIAGYNWLASTLYDFDSFGSNAAAGPTRDDSSEADSEARRREASQIWHRMLLLPRRLLSPTDVASAYSGLCRVAYDSNQSDLAYFLCSRADQAYRKLDSAREEQSTTRQNRAYVLDTIGVALEQKRMIKSPEATARWHCMPRNIKDVERVDGTWYARFHDFWSPYNRDALRYYEEALALTPDDAIIRCNAADSLAHLGDRSMLDALQGDARTRVALGDWFVALASNKSGSDSPPYYKAALQEYDAAARIDPSNVEALNSYGSAFWLWRFAATEPPPNGPGRKIAHRAEELARKAVRLAHGNVPLAEEAFYISTLGEVLLAQGRCDEGIEVLQRAQLPNLPAFDQIRLDLAQAYLCALDNSKRLELRGRDDSKLATKALDLLNTIRSHEQTREDRRYIADLLDISHVSLPYRWSADGIESSVAADAKHYSVRVDHKSQPPCTRAPVIGRVFDKAGDPVSEGFQMHLWGGGMDERIAIDTDDEMKTVLPGKPVRTQLYYFVQLEDSENHPLSAVKAMETSERCTRNQINLLFEPAK